jgi:alpha-tubulin suppressor-like RCC1 family protein
MRRLPHLRLVFLTSATLLSACDSAEGPYTSQGGSGPMTASSGGATATGSTSGSSAAGQGGETGSSSHGGSTSAQGGGGGSGGSGGRGGAGAGGDSSSSGGGEGGAEAGGGDSQGGGGGSGVGGSDVGGASAGGSDAGGGGASQASASTGGDPCADGFDDCDGEEANGCETPLETLTDCGGCDVTCDAANASETCTGGVCAIVACEEGFDDCDDDDDTGCEGDLASDAHCGACGEACEAGWTCEAGGCVMIPAVDLSVGRSNAQACAVLASGAVHCWGENDQGQLGNGTSDPAAFPTPVVGIDDATQVATGIAFTCVVRATGAVSCWGDNAAGTLGNGATTDSLLPVAAIGLDDVIAIDAAGQFACALRASGGVACWGSNVNGQLGNGTMTASAVPVDVVGLTDAVGIATSNLHACALRETGGVVCWGFGAFLGDGGTEDDATPVDVVGLSDATQIAGGTNHTCARRSGGSLVCWGAPFGITVPTPEPYFPGVDVAQVSAGNRATCVLRTDGLVECAGNNVQGQLAVGFAGTSGTFPPAALAWGGTPASDVTLVDIDQGTCVLRNEGEVWCAGPAGTLGDGQLLDPAGFSRGGDRWYLYPVRGRARRAFEDGSCTGGIDDDGDGDIDCADSDCATDAGSALGADVIEDVLDGRYATNYQEACGVETYREKRHLWRAPAAGTYRFVSTAASDTVLTIEGSGCGVALGCEDDATNATVGARVTVTLAAGQQVGIVVDARIPMDGPYQVAIEQQ